MIRAFLILLFSFHSWGADIELFNGKDLKGWKETDFGGQGEVKVKDGKIIANMGASLTGVQYTNSIPTNNYSITLEAMKIDGGDFFLGLTFPVGTNHCSLIVGGWGGGVVGLSNIDSLDASENETTKFVTFGTNKWHRFKVNVSTERIVVSLDDDKLIDQDLKDHTVSLRPGPIELQSPFGLSTYQTTAAWRNIKITPLTAKKP